VNMRYFLKFGLLIGVILGTSGTLEAQYQVMPGRTVGTPMGYSYGYPNYSSYGNGWAYRAPVAAPVIRYRAANPYGYVNRPYYGAFGYGNYSNGSTDGFPPFRSLRGR
jgi:hypothetical protein